MRVNNSLRSRGMVFARRIAYTLAILFPALLCVSGCESDPPKPPPGAPKETPEEPPTVEVPGLTDDGGTGGSTEDSGG